MGLRELCCCFEEGDIMCSYASGENSIERAEFIMTDGEGQLRLEYGRRSEST